MHGKFRDARHNRSELANSNIAANDKKITENEQSTACVNERFHSVMSVSVTSVFNVHVCCSDWFRTTSFLKKWEK